MDVETAIAATLERWKRESGDPGTSDCAMSVAGYVELLTGLDPALPWRGRYRTARGMVRLTRSAGGLHMILRAGLPPCGARIVADSRRGDVVVCRPDGTVDNETAGLHLGDFTAFRMAAGFALRRLPIFEAWRVTGEGARCG
ncbi:hypothetical protein [Mesorhizobium sp. J428]|uniref:DUF6950 family protein n=1 Tax=Mesorhizobium sp. J428 TaxID=2898440 RepID=UPI002151F765|nr:hypothetical protein [Mesorhizobium sp. J428]MCR5859729.1 hypothetical protein [Mesorhizobium sp. J428]